ncbi:solute carrier family 66 member 2-like [Saccoglossus kowalevskii]|uniref:PQ-loop repeat-containing protein 1-like n=1 Tax=Saccoglossus kowalevskii TaxID=10224 RepID=A0ABM0LVW9_SACKO|nr:PREDICTED: PQ-loop repeat-containing protein 1-like [Saccoglossus kowalevskii]
MFGQGNWTVTLYGQGNWTVTVYGQGNWTATMFGQGDWTFTVYGQDFDTRQFWKWNHFSDYVQFVALFSFFCGAITILLMDFPLYIETLGFMAVFTEAMLGAPQFYKNLQNRSTIGMSVKMVLFWLSGDTFKTGYFLVKNAPIQFTICGALQVSIDIAILWQVWHYRGKKPA